MKKVLAILLALVLCLSVTGAAMAAEKIGVSMPTQSLQRWSRDGANMKAELEAAGLEVDLQYANDDVAMQATQIQGMITGGCKVLVVAAINGSSLGTVLAEAKAQNIPVIAYDRLLMDTEAVSYYVTFDSYMAGIIQGQYIEEALDLKSGAGPFNMEIIAGDPGDNSALYFYRSAVDVLRPYIDSGKLVIPSGRLEFPDVAIPTGETDVAQARMDNLIAAFYADGTTLDAVLCSNDSAALGVINSLAAAGVETFPIITGQDCDIANIKNIIAGKQSMSIFKDTRALTAKVLDMVLAIMNGGQPEVNDTASYNNGIFPVPTCILTPLFVDAGSYRDLLIDTEYYTEDQLE